MQVIDGASMTLTGKLCLIVYSEDLWLSYDDAGRQFCKDTWLKKASVMDGVTRVVLRLIPDELFPMHGHEKPYIGWQHEIDRPPECGYAVEAVITVTVTGDAKYVDPVMRADISRTIEGSAQRGTNWRIVNSRGDLIEHGRL